MTAFAPWQQRVYATAAAAMDAGRLSHALLFAGPPRIGKRAVAERLALRALCLDRPRDGEPCGSCRSCRLFAARTQLDPPETRPDGSFAHPDGHPAHPDARFIGHAWNDKTGKMRGEIVIEQIRLMSEKLALTSQYGDTQVAIIDPAESINHAASNALLKTLEEPQPGRFIWLVTANPSRLSATIRSRTQILEFRLPAREEALAWLVGSGHGEREAREALQIARGHPGLAHQWLEGGALDLRAEVLADLERLDREPGSAHALAQRWTGDENAALRLRFAADAALEEAREGRLEPIRIQRLARWFDQANRTRELLRTTVRADLAVLELLMGWRDYRSGEGTGAGR